MCWCVCLLSTLCCRKSGTTRSSKWAGLYVCLSVCQLYWCVGLSVHCLPPVTADQRGQWEVVSGFACVSVCLLCWCVGLLVCCLPPCAADQRGQQTVVSRFVSLVCLLLWRVGLSVCYLPLCPNFRVVYTVLASVHGFLRKKGFRRTCPNCCTVLYCLHCTCFSAWLSQQKGFTKALS